MTAISISDFGGEIPSLSLRGLPGNTSAVNNNLLASSREFRPLQGDLRIANAPINAQSLYRLSRDAQGALRTDDTTGWIAETVERSYVKGQLNDDNTERTFASYNDGSLPLRAIDATGQSRTLGVQKPTGLTLKQGVVSQFTMADALIWADGTLLPAMLKAIRDGVSTTDPAARFTGTTAVAGPKSTYNLTFPTTPTSQRGVSESWNLLSPRTAGVAADMGVDDPQLGGIVVNGTHWLAISALPLWPTIADAPALKARIRVILNPKDGSQLFADPVIETLATKILARYATDDVELMALRSELDDAIKSFRVGLDFVPTPVSINQRSRPKQPAPPEWLEDKDGNITGRSPAWDTYDTNTELYLLGKTTALDSKTESKEDKLSRIAKMVADQATAARCVKDIEALYVSRNEALTDWIKEIISDTGLVKNAYNPSGLIAVDPDRIIDTRFYIATYVTDWNEESIPTDLDLVAGKLDVDQNDTVTVTIPAPSGDGAQYITKWRLYRSNSGANSAAFQYVDEILIANTTYIDSLKGSQLQEVCPSTTWQPPPKRKGSQPNPYLRGLVGMPNGMMAAFMDNIVTFCEPWIPHAWPVEYQITTEHPIVGIGAFGQSLFVGTLGNPYIISGSDSASMSAQKLDVSQACASRRSIVSAMGGVFYASPDGICFAGPGGVEVVTSNLFNREDWQKLSPKTIVASFHEGIYYFWYGGNAGGCYALDTNAKKLCRVDMAATCVFADSLTDALFYVQGGAIKRAFAASRRVGLWRSGRAVLPSPAGLAWLKVTGDQDASNPVTVRWYGDGQLVSTTSVTSKDPVRLPPGRYQEHEVEIESSVRLTRVLLTNSTLELVSA